MRITEIITSFVVTGVTGSDSCVFVLQGGFGTTPIPSLERTRCAGSNGDISVASLCLGVENGAVGLKLSFDVFKSCVLRVSHLRVRLTGFVRCLVECMRGMR